MNNENTNRARAITALNILKLEAAIIALEALKDEMLMPKPSNENIDSIAGDAIAMIKITNQQIESLTDTAPGKN